MYLYSFSFKTYVLSFDTVVYTSKKVSTNVQTIGHMPLCDWLVDLTSLFFHPICDEIAVCVIVDFTGLEKLQSAVIFLNFTDVKGEFLFLDFV